MRVEQLVQGGATTNPGIEWPACPHCGDMLLAPETSVLVGLGDIRHTWCCDSCGHGFETTVRLLPSGSADPD